MELIEVLPTSDLCIYINIYIYIYIYKILNIHQVEKIIYFSDSSLMVKLHEKNLIKNKAILRIKTKTYLILLKV